MLCSSRQSGSHQSELATMLIPQRDIPHRNSPLHHSTTPPLRYSSTERLSSRVAFHARKCVQQEDGRVRTEELLRLSLELACMRDRLALSADLPEHPLADTVLHSRVSSVGT